jgi:alpha-L-rhamnosidase
MEGLHDLGLAELSYELVTQQDYPGWKTLITEGVMKETWAGGLAQMPSLGGSIGQWFFKAAGGIRPDPTGPGFRKIIIKPTVMGDLTWVKCSYDSNYGRIASNWKREGQALTFEVAIPPNTTATLYVPAKDAASVTESGKSAGKSLGVKFLRMDEDRAVYEVGSGMYTFVSKT